MRGHNAALKEMGTTENGTYSMNGNANNAVKFSNKTDEEKATDIITAASVGMAGGDYVDTKELIRSFWYYVSPVKLKDSPLALKMLRHSVSSENPEPFTEKDFPKVGEKISADSDFQNALNKLMQSLDSNESTLYDKKIHIEFNANRDLKLALHGADIYISGTKNLDGTWDLDILVDDTYDYTEFIKDKERYEKDFEAVVANNAAVCSQAQNVIKPYKVAFKFKIKYPIK